MPARPEDEPPEREPHGHPADGAYDELQVCLPQRERPRRYGSHAYPVGDDASCVVDEALAFEDRHYAPGYAEALGDRSRSYGVCGGDYGAENEGRSPR